MDLHAQARHTQASPPVQAMDADPTVVDAAVRFCDDVLASPYVTLEASPVWNPSDCNPDPTPYTVTLPITDSSGEKALSMIIEVPELYQWHGSIVTAEGVSVARMSNKSRKRDNLFDLFTAPVPVEWDQSGKTFAEVNEDSEKCDCCVPNSDKPRFFVEGPRERIYLSVAESHPTRLKLCKAACWLLPLGIVPAFVACFPCCYPMEHAFRDGYGEKVIGKRVSSNTLVCCPMTPGGQNTSLHIEDMTSEQRRLALVAVMYEAGVYYSSVSSGGG